MTLAAFNFSDWIDRHAHLLKPPVGNQMVFAEAGDLIVSAGDREIRDAGDLHDALGALSRPFALGLVRGAEERTVPIGEETAPARTPGDA